METTIKSMGNLHSWERTRFGFMPQAHVGMRTVCRVTVKACNTSKYGELAKLGSRCVRNAEGRGSNPLFSTIFARKCGIPGFLRYSEIRDY